MNQLQRATHSPIRHFANGHWDIAGAAAAILATQFADTLGKHTGSDAPVGYPGGNGMNICEFVLPAQTKDANGMPIDHYIALEFVVDAGDPRDAIRSFTNVGELENAPAGIIAALSTNADTGTFDTHALKLASGRNTTTDEPHLQHRPIGTGAHANTAILEIAPGTHACYAFYIPNLTKPTKVAIGYRSGH